MNIGNCTALVTRSTSLLADLKALAEGLPSGDPAANEAFAAYQAQRQATMLIARLAASAVDINAKSAVPDRAASGRAHAAKLRDIANRIEVGVAADHAPVVADAEAWANAGGGR